MKKGIVIRAFSEDPDFLGSATFLSKAGRFRAMFCGGGRVGF